MVSSTRAIDAARRHASEQLDPRERARLGQFMTPSAIADFMASLFTQWPDDVRLLDPGAGIGSLTEAFAEKFFQAAPSGATLEVHAFEIDRILSNYLKQHLEELAQKASMKDFRFHHHIHDRDFILEASFQAELGGRRFTHVILNPPYKKLSTNSNHRKVLRKVGIETVNLYTAFLGLAVALTEPNGEIVAIVPRSFCNGTYFRPFREWLLAHATIEQVHVFESRLKAFEDDEVLQENVIVRLQRGTAQKAVTISTSHDAQFADYEERRLPFEQIVKPADRERFIHVPVLNLVAPSWLFASTLEELDLGVSTGPVVDFRVRDHWLAQPDGRAVPLLYAHHFAGGLTWPRESKKPNALALNDDTRKWLMPRGWYCVTRRFSAKEEARRLVAYVVNPDGLPGDLIGFENHLNVFHSRKAGLSPDVAYGLSVFLNSTIADQHFRTFSGHTQVNATDLRTMRYPGKNVLQALGSWARVQTKLTQEKIDAYLTGHEK